MRIYEPHSKASLGGKIAHEMLFEPPGLNNSSVDMCVSCSYMYSRCKALLSICTKSSMPVLPLKSVY